MDKRCSFVVLGGLALSGLAIACAMLPMPPVSPVVVSALDIAIAGAQGYDNPARAAAMKKLDTKGSSIDGADSWKNNNYVGPVTYTVGSAAGVVVTEDKSCKRKAIETQSKGSSSTAGGGSIGGYYWSGGRVWGSAGDCLYGCGTVTVGELQEA